jgi:hypothetical protein
LKADRTEARARMDIVLVMLGRGLDEIEGGLYSDEIKLNRTEQFGKKRIGRKTDALG